MKRALAVLVIWALCLSFACGETEIQPFESVLVLISCPSLSGFDQVPSPQLAGEAIGIYRLLYPDKILTAEEIYRLVFARGSYDETAAVEPYDVYPSRYETESETMQPDGSITLCVRCETDFGFGYEFNMYCEITVDPETLAIIKLFIPD